MATEDEKQVSLVRQAFETVDTVRHPQNFTVARPGCVGAVRGAELRATPPPAGGCVLTRMLRRMEVARSNVKRFVNWWP